MTLNVKTQQGDSTKLKTKSVITAESEEEARRRAIALALSNGFVVCSFAKITKKVR
jgi:hypothetical protein